MKVIITRPWHQHALNLHQSDPAYTKRVFPLCLWADTHQPLPPPCELPEGGIPVLAEHCACGQAASQQPILFVKYRKGRTEVPWASLLVFPLACTSSPSFNKPLENNHCYDSSTLFYLACKYKVTKSGKKYPFNSAPLRYRSLLQAIGSRFTSLKPRLSMLMLRQSWWCQGGAAIPKQECQPLKIHLSVQQGQCSGPQLVLFTVPEFYRKQQR